MKRQHWWLPPHPGGRDQAETGAIGYLPPQMLGENTPQDGRGPMAMECQMWWELKMVNQWLILLLISWLISQ